MNRVDAKWKLRTSLILNILLVAAIVVVGMWKFGLQIAQRGGGSFESNDKYTPFVTMFEEDCAIEKSDWCFVGDSLTRNALWDEFFPEKTCVNRGIGSDVSEGVLNRVETICSSRPDVVFLMIGTNDLGENVAKDKTIENIEAVVERIHENLPDTKIVPQSVLPTNAYDAQVRALNVEHEAIASHYDWIDYLSLHPLFLDSQGQRNKALYSSDNVHLNGAGYRVWIDAIERWDSGNERS